MVKIKRDAEETIRNRGSSGAESITSKNCGKTAQEWTQNHEWQNGKKWKNESKKKERLARKYRVLRGWLLYDTLATQWFAFQ